LNKDGDLLDAGEGLARWASNGTQGSEFTGLYFDKFNSNVAYVNIQHPTSGNDRTMQINAVPVPGAIWLFGSAIAGMIGLRRSKA
jgi:secreted PhoX family phosphatase